MSMYVRERVQMFAKIREECKLEYIENMDDEWQLNILIGEDGKKKESKLEKYYLRKANEIRKKYI